MKSFGLEKKQKNKSSALVKPLTIIYAHKLIKSSGVLFIFIEKCASRRILPLLLMTSGLAILLGTVLGFFPCTKIQQSQQQPISYIQK